MKFLTLTIIAMVFLLNPAFAMEELEKEYKSSKVLLAKSSKTLLANIFKKDKEYEMPNSPTSVTPLLTSYSSGQDVRVGTADVFSNCLNVTFNIHNSGRIIGQAHLKYFPDHTTFWPRFTEIMTNLAKTRPMTDEEKMEQFSFQAGIHPVEGKILLKTYPELKHLNTALDNLNLSTHPSGWVSYTMDLGLTMPILYLDSIRIEENYQRQGHGTRALETIITAFDNAQEAPENAHILLQCNRTKDYSVGSPDSEHKTYFKRFGFESINIQPWDRHFMTVSLEEIKFPRRKKHGISK